MIKNKVFVRFIITSPDLSPLDITANIGIQPSRTWKKDDLKTEKGTMKHKDNGWELYLKEYNVLHTEDILKKLIKILSPIKEKMVLLHNIKKTISIVVYPDGTLPSFSYDTECTEFFNTFKVNLDFDIYS